MSVPDPATTSWVPLAVGGGGGGVDYIGTWDGGTAYKAGDVVRYNGIDYLAVNPSTGQVPPASAAATVTQNMPFNFSLETTAPPAVGEIRLNNSDPWIANKVYVSDWAANGLSARQRILELRKGYRILIQNKAVPGNYWTVELSGNAVAQSGYVELPVQFQNARGSFPTAGLSDLWEYITPYLTPNYATSFPSSPANADEAILIDSTSAPTYGWRFRYSTAIADAYKWLALGAQTPLVSENDGTTVLTAGGSAAYQFSLGVSVTVPRSGIYEIEYGCSSDATSNPELIYSYSIDAAAPNDNDGAFSSHYGSTNETIFRRLRRTLVAGNVLTLKVKETFANGNVTFSRRRIAITPVRVS